MSKKWNHQKTIVDGDKFEINGLNIWDYKWAITGEKISVKDPLYGKQYAFNVFEIENKNKKISFAAGEFSNCVWGIYQME